MNEKPVNIYIKAVKSILPFYTRNERIFIYNLKAQLLNSFSNREDCSYDSISVMYGSPSSVVSSYIDELEYSEVKSNLRKKRKKSIFFVCLIFLVILVSSIRIYLLNEEYHDVSEGIIVYEESFIVETEPEIQQDSN